MRPIVEIMTVNFSLLALDQIVNTAASLHHMSGGQFSVPLVIRMTTGAGRQLAAQHSHSLENWYAHVPGLVVLAPATVADARGMLWPALEHPDPVIFFEHGALYNESGEADVTDLDPAPDDLLQGGGATSGATTSRSSPTADRCRRRWRPPRQLAADGVSAEVDRPAGAASARLAHRARRPSGGRTAPSSSTRGGTRCRSPVR